MFKAIARVQTENREVNQLQSNIISSLQPLTQNPLVSGRIVKQVSLKNGTNTINHGLNRTLIGWFLVRKRGNANIYDNQDNNKTPEINLILISSADVDVDIYVF